MSDVFFVADTHFGHSNILKHEPQARPFASIDEHDEELVRRWNERVDVDDIVWVLGDVAWSVKAYMGNVFERLHGRLRLVLGDHDQLWFAHIGAREFVEVHGVVEWENGIVLSHMPVILDGQKYGRCIHGHTHSSMIYREVFDQESGHTCETEEEDPRYCCVSIEHTNLAPISWDEIKARKGW